GDTRAAAELAGRLPAASIRSSPHLCLLAARQAIAVGDATEAAGWLALADGAAARLGRDARGRDEAGRTVGLLLHALRTCDDGELDRSISGLVHPDAVGQGSRSGEARRTLAVCARGALATWRGELDDAAAMLESALDASRRLELRECELESLALLALVSAV